MNLLFDVRHRAAEGKAKEGHARDPANTTDEAVGKEFPVRHTANASHGRRKSANDRDKARQDERLRAIFIVEFLRSKWVGRKRIS